MWSVSNCPLIYHWSQITFIHFNIIAIATTEADEDIASSDFLKIMGISPAKGANRGDSG